MITYESIKLPNKFSVKHKTDFMHKNSVVYYSKCPTKDVRTIILTSPSKDNNIKLKTLLLKHAQEKTMLMFHVWESNFKISGNNYQ